MLGNTILASTRYQTQQVGKIAFTAFSHVKKQKKKSHYIHCLHLLKDVRHTNNFKTGGDALLFPLAPNNNSPFSAPEVFVHRKFDNRK